MTKVTIKYENLQLHITPKADQYLARVAVDALQQRQKDNKGGFGLCGSREKQLHITL